MAGCKRGLRARENLRLSSFVVIGETTKDSMPWVKLKSLTFAIIAIIINFDLQN